MKDPKVRRLPSGNYNCRVQVNGETISITRATEMDCKNEARLLKAEAKAGKRNRIYQTAQDKTLAELETEYVKANRAVLSPATVRSYLSYINHRFKGYSCKSVKFIRWQNMINDELQIVSEKTVRNAWGLASASLKAAGLPVPNVKLAQCPVNEIPFLQPDEILKFCETIHGKPYETAALLMLHGLRLSEACGLMWGNIDTKHNTITVRGAMVRGPEGLKLKQTNKNSTSSRTLPIMIPRLKELLSVAESMDPSETIVKTNPSNLLENVKRACRKAGITETTCHGLRHSFASLCYRTPGVSERQVMQWGGWSNIQTMHKIYIRIAAKDETAAAKAVQDFFRKGKTLDSKVET